MLWKHMEYEDIIRHSNNACNFAKHRVIRKWVYEIFDNLCQKIGGWLDLVQFYTAEEQSLIRKVSSLSEPSEAQCIAS